MHVGSAARRWLAVLLVAACALVPLWTVSVPPMLDYHNHLARQYVLANLESSAHLSEFYRANWRASPYLALDGVVQMLTPLMPVDVAGKIFLVLMLSLLGLAPVALSLALFGRVTPFALLGLLFVHNQTVTLGFVNYLFGVGLALCAFALWIRLRLSAAWVRLVVFPLVCSLVFFSHLIGFVVYVLAVGSYELAHYLRGVRERGGRGAWRVGPDHWLNLSSLLLQCALPLAIYAAWGPSPGGGAANHTYGDLERKFSLLAGAFGYLIPAYSWRFDRAVQVALPLAVALGLALRWVVVDGRMLLPLAAMLGLFFAMPMELFGGWGADHRLLVPLGLLLVGSLRPADDEGIRTWPWVTAAIVAVVAARAVFVTVEWRKADAQYAEYFRAFDAIPHGAVVWFGFGHAGERALGLRPVYQLPTLVLSRRDVYVPYLFARDSGLMPLAYQPAWKLAQKGTGGPVLTHRDSPKWPVILERFDYVLLVNERHFDEPIPDSLSLVFEGPTVRVYRGPRAPRTP